MISLDLSKICAVFVDEWGCHHQSVLQINIQTKPKLTWFLLRSLSNHLAILFDDMDTYNSTFLQNMLEISWTEELFSFSKIWKAHLHSSAWGERSLLHVQTAPWLHTQQPEGWGLCHAGQKDRGLLRSRHQHHCQGRPHASRQKGPVGQSLQKGAGNYVFCLILIQIKLWLHILLDKMQTYSAWNPILSNHNFKNIFFCEILMKEDLHDRQTYWSCIFLDPLCSPPTWTHII